MNALQLFLPCAAGVEGFLADEVHALASRKLLGAEVSYGDATLKAKDVDAFDFSTVQLCIMATGDARGTAEAVGRELGLVVGVDRPEGLAGWTLADAEAREERVVDSEHLDEPIIG